MGHIEQLTIEPLIWSAQAGAYAMLLLVSVGIAGIHRTTAAYQQLVWLAICFLMNICINGFVKNVSPALSDTAFQTLRVAAGPFGTAISLLGLRNWLDLRRRHRRMSTSLVAMAIASMVAGLACFTMDADRQFATSGWIALATGLGAAGVCMWAGLLGDRLSWLMAFASVILMAATGIEYGLATQSVAGTEGHGLQVISAFTIVVGMLMISALIWLRSHNEYESLRRNITSTEYDPTTQLYNGKTLIQKIGHAQARLKLRAEQGMILAVVVTGLDALTAQIGSGGVHELLMRAGARVRKDAGLINPVGRYFDACFVVLIETMNDREDIHRLVNTLQQSFRQPMDIRGLHGETQSVTLQVGIGLARLSHQSDISSVLQRAENAALASRNP